MGAKATFNSETRVITLTEAPDANGDVTIDVQVDLYSDGKEDWRQNEPLRRLLFPLRAVGGVSKPGGKKQGTSYFIQSDWKIQPYDADHRLIIEGDLSSEDGSDPILTCPGRTVKTLQQTAEYSTVFEVETGGGEKDWTDQEHDDILTDISAIKGKTANLPDDPASESNVDAQIGSLNDLSASDVKAQADQALVDYDPPTRLEAAADKDEILSDISSLNDISQSDVQQAMTDQGYTTMRAPKLDNLDEPISDVPTEVDNQLSAAHGSDSWEGGGSADPGVIADAVLDESVIEHQQSGSLGAFIKILLDDVSLLKTIETGRWKIAGNQLIMYALDGKTVIRRFSLLNSAGQPTQPHPSANVFERRPL